MRESDWVELGRIGSPFGIEGGMHIDSFTEPTEALFGYEVWSVRLATGQRVDHRVVEARPQGNRFVVYFDGVEDRDAAARLTGSMIEVQRGQLPPAGEREHYSADLIGLRVVNLEDVELGTVRHFVHGTAQPVMLVKGEREHLVPAVPQHLKKVDMSAGTILVDWPAEFDE
jgi:16S rRNA processing protein RimM